MTGNRKKYLLISALIVLALLAAIGLGLVPLNLSWAKPAISDAVRANLGLNLHIHGPLRVRLGRKPVISATKVVLSNPAENDAPLVQVDQLAAWPRLIALLQGDIFLRKLDVSDVEFDYCQESFYSQESAPQSPDADGLLPAIAIDKLAVGNVRLGCSVTGEGFDWIPDRLDLKASAPMDKPVEASIEGTGGKNDLILTFSGGSLTELLESPGSYPFKTELRVADTLKLNASARTMDDGIVVERLKGSLDDHNFILSGLARGFYSRPYFEIEARLDQLDMRRLSEALAENGAGGSEETDFQPVYDLLAQFDAHVSIKIDQLPNAPLTASKLVIEASLENRLLRLDKAGVLLAESPMTANAIFDMRPGCARLVSELQVSGFELRELNHFLGDKAALGGHLGRARLGSDSCGATLQEHVESLQVTVAATDLTPSWNNEELPLVFQSLETWVNWSEPGRFLFDGTLNGETLSTAITFGAIDSILSGHAWPLSVSATGSDSRLNIVGDVAISEEGLDLDISIDLDVQRFGALHTWIGARQENRLTLSGHTGLKFNRDGLALEELDARLGRSDIRGTVTLARQELPQPMTIDLTSRRLDFNELSSLFPEPQKLPVPIETDWSELFTDVGWVQQWMKFPQANIDLRVSELAGINYDVSEVDLHVLLHDRLVDDGHLALRFEDIGFDGDIEMDFRKLPGNISYDVELKDFDVGRILAKLDMAEGVDLKADRFNASLVSEGASLRQLAENSSLDARFKSLKWRFTTGPENMPHELDLSELELSAAPDSASIWRMKGSFNGVPVKALMHTPSVGVTFDSSKGLPLKLIIGATKGVTMIEAVFDRRTPGNLHGELRMSGELMNPQSIDFSRLQSPLGDYEFRSGLTIRENQLLLSDLQARIGESRASGTVDIIYEGPGCYLNIDLSSPFLETADLVEWAEDWRNAHKNLMKRKLAIAADETNDAGFLPLIRQQADKIFTKNNFDIKFDIDELRSDDSLLGRFELLSRSEGDNLELDVDISLPGGDIKAGYSVMHLFDGIEYGLDIHADRFEYGGLLRLFDPESKAAGLLYLDTSVTSSAPDQSRLVSNMQGHFDLAVLPKHAKADFLDLWASNIIFAVLPKGDSDGKKMNCMVARFGIENGVMKSTKTFLDSTDIIVRARGNIDLVNRELDLWLAPQAKLEKFLSIQTPLVVTGPFDNPDMGIAPGGFLTTILRMYYGLIYVPWKWLTGERFPTDGIATCYRAMDWELPESPN